MGAKAGRWERRHEFEGESEQADSVSVGLGTWALQVSQSILLRADLSSGNCGLRERWFRRDVGADPKRHW